MSPSTIFLSFLLLSLSAASVFARGEIFAPFRGTAVAAADHPGYADCLTQIRIETLEISPEKIAEFGLRAGESVTIFVEPKRGECPKAGQGIAGTLVFKPVQYHGDQDAHYGQNLRW